MDSVLYQFYVYFITQTYPLWPECAFKERTIYNLIMRLRPILSVFGIVFIQLFLTTCTMICCFKRSQLQSTLWCLTATLLHYSSNSLETIANQSPTHKAANLKSVTNLLCDVYRLTFFSPHSYPLFSPHPSFHSWKKYLPLSNRARGPYWGILYGLVSSLLYGTRLMPNVFLSKTLSVS